MIESEHTSRMMFCATQTLSLYDYDYQSDQKFWQAHRRNRLTMQIESGELFGFLGPNGAGKTTTINMRAGLIRPTAGTATICGYDIQAEAIQAKAITGLMPDTPSLYDTLTGRQYVPFHGGFIRDTFPEIRKNAWRNCWRRWIWPMQRMS